MLETLLVLLIMVYTAGFLFTLGFSIAVTGMTGRNSDYFWASLLWPLFWFRRNQRGKTHGNRN